MSLVADRVEALRVLDRSGDSLADKRGRKTSASPCGLSASRQEQNRLTRQREWALAHDDSAEARLIKTARFVRKMTSP